MAGVIVLPPAFGLQTRTVDRLQPDGRFIPGPSVGRRVTRLADSSVLGHVRAGA